MWFLRLCKALGALTLTVVGLVALATAVAVGYLFDLPFTWLIALPLALLALNLLAAIVSNGQFRRQVPLLVFHLALLALIALAAAGRLTFLQAQFELAEGQAFEGELFNVERGPLHDPAFDFVFVNEGFEAEYYNGMYAGTRNRVRWRTEDGVTGAGVVGTRAPLVVGAYRIYPSSHQGYAAVLRWHPEGGEPAIGSVHLPSFPAAYLRQSTEWPLPDGGRALWLMLELPDGFVHEEGRWRFSRPPRHTLVVRDGEAGARHELAPGDGVQLPGGRLTYLELSTWKGYVVHYDWTRPWLLAATLVAVFGLGWHYWRKFAARPWRPVPDERRIE